MNKKAFRIDKAHRYSYPRYITILILYTMMMNNRKEQLKSFHQSTILNSMKSY